MKQLVWFRTDLRIADNPALTAAMAAGPTVALYVLTPDQWRDHDDADCKVDFWLRNASELARALARLNVPLLVREAERWRELPSLVADLCSSLEIVQVHVNCEAGVNESRRDKAVGLLLAQRGVRLTAQQSQTLLPPGSVLTQAGTCFQVFRQFRRSCVERLRIAPPGVLPAPRRQQPLAIASNAMPPVAEGFSRPPRALRALWPAGESHASDRLNAFVERAIAHYHERRDCPSLDGTSRLSPYLAAGVLSPRQCLQAALNSNHGEFDSGSRGAIAWIDELLWREFYKHLLHCYPRLSMGKPFRAEAAFVRWRDAPADLAAWQQGETGFPIVDAAMRQLLATGWMHNRLRMVTAMFLTKNLLIDWRLGEQWFMRHLIDGDLAANNGGWQWSASTGTDAAPYFRVFNPLSQARRFDPDGDFVRAWLPELRELDGPSVHEPWTAQDLFRTVDYPPPIVDLRSSRVRAIEAFRTLPRPA